jgi:hypothetical protein
MGCLVAPVVVVEIKMLALKQAEELETAQLFRHLKVVMVVLERQLNMVAQEVAVVHLLLALPLLLSQVVLVEMARRHLFLVLQSLILAAVVVQAGQEIRLLQVVQEEEVQVQ